MQIPKSAYIAIIAGLSGCLVGGFVVSGFWSRNLNRVIRNSSEANAVTAIHNLRLIRQEKFPVAIEFLEIQLDGDILSLGSSLKSSPSNKNDINGTLKKIAEYRKQFPYPSTSPETQKEVDRVLALVNQ